MGVLHVAQDAVASVVEDEEGEAGPLLGEGEEFAEVDGEAAVACDDDGGGVGAAECGADAHGEALSDASAAGKTLVAGSVISSSRFPQVEEGMVTSRAMTDAGGQASRIASLTAACGPIA